MTLKAAMLKATGPQTNTSRGQVPNKRLASVDYLRAVAPPLAVPIHQALLARPDKYYGLLGELAPAATKVHVPAQGAAIAL